MLYSYFSILGSIPAVALLLLLAANDASSQPRKVLLLTHSAGFRHDSIQTARSVLEGLDERLAVFSTEDLSYVSAARLAEFDAVFLFTSGELALTEEQKSDLLAFVRSGNGFGGAHSATDTLYAWPEYGELIGAYFDGHPWVQEATIHIEDPEHPATKGMGPTLRIAEEFYQFRDFSRDRVRVLMTLDPNSIDLNAPGVNRTDRDFALAWTRAHGSGRVFYTALGHFDETWKDRRFQEMLRGALLWLTGQAEGEGTPRPLLKPEIPTGALVNAFSYLAGDGFTPGEVVAIFGSNLSTGSAMPSHWPETAGRLAGTEVTLDGKAVRLYYASPGQINAVLPQDAQPSERSRLRVTVGPSGNFAEYEIRIKAASN